MKPIRPKNELSLALVWIGTYCLIQWLAHPLNRLLGVGFSASAALDLGLGLGLLGWLKRRELLKHCGLCRPVLPARRFLYYLPLLLLAASNLWGAAVPELLWAELFFRSLLMLLVGFWEEVLFRGLLFRALEPFGRRRAMVLSSLSFGLGHLMNLSGDGAALALLQTAGALALGLLFVLVLDRSGSLLPCILTHGAINVLSAFAPPAGSLLPYLFLLAVSVLYGLFLARTLPPQGGSCSSSP